MKSGLIFLGALTLSAPAHALSIVTLHGSITAPLAIGSVDTSIVVGSIIALTAVIGLRMRKR